ncbi:hypothetical protein Tco_0979625, partial [Tanacetum coccineum]
NDTFRGRSLVSSAVYYEVAPHVVFRCVVDKFGGVTPTETPIIPPSPDYTPASPDYSPASDSESDPSEDPSSDHIPPLPDISPFLSSTDDTTDSDTSNTPPSLPMVHLSLRLPLLPKDHLSYLKRVGPFLVPRLAVGHPVDHSSSKIIFLNDSVSRFFFNSTSEATSNFHSMLHLKSFIGALIVRIILLLIYRVLLRGHLTRDVGPPRRLYLHYHRADLIPSPKRVKDSGYLADVEVDPREISLRDDAIVRVSNEPHLEQDIDPEIQAEIDECIAYADALRDRGIDARVVVEVVDQDETETGVKGPVEVKLRGSMITRLSQSIVYRLLKGVQREQGHRIVGVESTVTALTKRVAELEWITGELRGTVSVESSRLTNSKRDKSRMQRELRQT